MSSCKRNEMRFDLLEIKELAGIPSASGIEETAGGRFIIGDDSPWLFRLNISNEITQRILLLKDTDLPEEVYEKAIKPDFEAITTNSNGEKLYIFGSGSKSPPRDILIEYDIVGEVVSGEYSLVEFYTNLRMTAGISVEELNIEAAELVGEYLYLFNRGRNFIARYPVIQFEDFLKGGEVPNPEIAEITLPKINEIEAGFSGASFAYKLNAFIFTATVEDTANWIDDGEVLGSFLGYLPLEELFSTQEPPLSILIGKEGESLAIKVESVTVLPTSTANKTDLLLVTDSDGGKSLLLTGSLHFAE